MRKVIERLSELWSELHRRKVFTVGAAYLVAAWGASVGVAELLPAFGAPEWTVRFFVIAAALGFPVTLVLAWVYEITARGVVKDEGRNPYRRASDVDGPQTQSASAGTLEVSWEDSAGPHTMRFDRGFVIGRDAACGLRLDDPMVSRQHARVRLERGVWLLEDLGSRNGTLLDGALVERVALPRRASVRLYAAGPALRLEQQASGATTVRAVLPGDETRVTSDR